MTTREDTIEAYRKYMEAKKDVEDSLPDLKQKSAEMTTAAQWSGGFSEVLLCTSIASCISAPALSFLFYDPMLLSIWGVAGVSMLGFKMSTKKYDEKKQLERTIKGKIDNLKNLKSAVLDTAAEEAKYLGFNVLTVQHGTQHINTTEGIITLVINEDGDIPELVLNNQIIQASYRADQRIMTGLNGNKVAIASQPLVLS